MVRDAKAAIFSDSIFFFSFDCEGLIVSDKICALFFFFVEWNFEAEASVNRIKLPGNKSGVEKIQVGNSFLLLSKEKFSKLVSHPIYPALVTLLGGSYY